MVDTIRRIAKEKGLTLSMVEETAGIGTNTIYRWDEKRPSIDRVKRVADVLNVPVDDLIREEKKGA